MLLNKIKFAILILGAALAGLISACSGNQAAVQSSSAAAAGSTVSQSKNSAAQSSTDNGSSSEANSKNTKRTEASGSLIQKSVSQASQADIGAEKAKELALAKAGIDSADVTFINIDLDRDNGKLEYDVEFHSNGMEYEVSVDAYTGAINEYSSEAMD